LLTTRLPILQVRKGFGGSGMGLSLEHARSLCERTGDRRQLFVVLWHLVSFHIGQNRPREALGLAREAMDLAESIGDPVLLAGAHNAVGESCYWLGDRKSAMENLGGVLRFYDTNRFEAMLSLYGVDIWVVNEVLLAWAQHENGWLDQALKRSTSGRARPRTRAFSRLGIRPDGGVLDQNASP
jgi:hypothetical protein